MNVKNMRSLFKKCKKLEFISFGNNFNTSNVKDMSYMFENCKNIEYIEDDVAQDVQNKFPSKKIGVVCPILSRNRFSIVLKGIARAMDKITVLTSFPADDEVHLNLDGEYGGDAPAIFQNLKRHIEVFVPIGEVREINSVVE